MSTTVPPLTAQGHPSPQVHKRHRHATNKAEKSRYNAEKAENHSRTALVLGGGAPNMALMAGALAAFTERRIRFDVVSTSGAGSLAGLMWLAPKGQSPAEALRSVKTMSITDLIYQYLPVNHKIFHKPGPWAEMWRSAMAANPLFVIKPQVYLQWPLYAFWTDWIALCTSTLCPSGLDWNSWGLCASPPFVEHIIDFDKIAHIKPHFYLNAYNMSKEIIENFTKDVITPDHFRAALAFPFIYGPFRLNGDLYYEGAVVDCLNFKDLTELHTGLQTIVVFDVLGSDTLIREPRNIYDSWVLSMIIPLVKTAEDNLELFALKHNDAKADLLKVEFDIPEEYLTEVLDWSASNAARLFDIGHRSGLRFVDENSSKLSFAP